MIIVLQEQSSSDTIVFSSVTSFDESYSGTVTSHPVEDSTTITDHFITDNDKFKISGVVSDFDFLNPLNQIAFGVDGYEDNSVASQSLIRFKNGELTNGTGVIPSNKTQNAIKNRLIQIHKLGQFVTVLMYQTPLDASTPALIASKVNCIITNISFKEDAESGYAVYPELSLERVKIVRVSTESIAKGKIPSIQVMRDALQSIVDKGKSDNCLNQTITKDVGTEKQATSVNKPNVPKGTKVDPCKPVGEAKEALRGLTYLEQLNGKIASLVDINLEIENTYRALSNVIPAAERSELNQRLKDLKAAYKAVNLFGGQ